MRPSKRHVRPWLCAVAVLYLIGCVPIADRDAIDGYVEGDESFWAAGSGGIVVTEEVNATRVAVDILRAGGNAIDAAVAATFALAVTYPEAGNIGGGGFVVAYDAGAGDFWALDFRETAPAAAHEDMYMELAGRRPDAAVFGPLACAIPGTPAGLHAAWQKSGSMVWAQLVAPAVDLASGGFAVGERLSESLASKRADLRRCYSTRKIFFKNERPLRQGERLVQKDLGASLAQIAREGPSAFYHGTLAHRLVRGVRAAGGIWTREDLAGYRPLFRKPCRIIVQESQATRIELVTMPPPSSGAVVFGQTLAFMKSQGTLDLPAGDPRRLAGLVEALRLAFADRNTRLADPARMSTTIDELLSPDYLAGRAKLLPVEPPGDSNAISGGHPGAESVNTTSVVVMDGRGNVVSLTTTVNALFGSKFVAPGTGILLNDEMDDFDTLPGKPNLYGLVGSGVNAVAPGARMLSSMSPTIVLKNGEPWLALSSRGGPRILTSILQVFLYRCFDGMDLVKAVAAPRVHHQWWPDEVLFEDKDTMDKMRKALAAMGYKTGIKDAIGRVIAVERLGDGKYLGVRDPRISGLALPVDPSGGRTP